MRALGPGKQLSVSDWGFGHSSQAFTLDDGAPLVLTIPSGNTAVTTGTAPLHPEAPASESKTLDCYAKQDVDETLCHP